VEARYDRLFSGLAIPRPAFIPEGTTGYEQLTPEDTLDADHGRLLECAYAALASPTDRHGKVVASSRGLGTVCTVERKRLIGAA
jgi:hypothetical protein